MHRARVFEWLFFLVSIVELTAELNGNELTRIISKPLLMVSLITFYVQSVNGSWNKVHKLIVTAFCFSWVGDVALMFVSKNESFFLLGLVGFLITHLLYIASFSMVTDIKKSTILSQKFYVVIPLVFYIAILLYLLVPVIMDNEKMQPLLIPVLVYSIAIATMVLFSINRYKRVNNRSFILVVFGALLFMVSDSIIAINKFLYSFPSAGIFIMAFYIVGQYSIAKGILVQYSSRKMEGYLFHYST